MTEVDSESDLDIPELKSDTDSSGTDDSDFDDFIGDIVNENGLSNRKLLSFLTQKKQTH